ncbi:hypothetical protein JX580_06520 [Thiomicrospira microaerophila]|uniref:hypothetical protein n=1 Tax=Thiomicrospira microaerophila TaxID=406020 RepID=UPI00200E392B|nr:hypothetical protein [Thiomicrospira microaerophila]UQB41353.1 hypothetical protein JX580_06520 [Thiomicrospira microaerophila]
MYLLKLQKNELSNVWKDACLRFSQLIPNLKPRMVLLVVLAFVYNKLNPVTRGILGLASAAGEQWFIVFIKKPWQFRLSGLFYWRYKPNQLAGTVWR